MHAPGNSRLARFLTPLLAIGAGLYRILPVKLPNFAPIGGAALYAGARLPLFPALAWPFVAMAGSDLVLWALRGDEPFLWAVYLAYAGYVLLGRAFLRNSESPILAGGVAALASGLFFLVTNLACWPGYYPMTLAGLMECYAAGIPFIGYTLVSDIGFSVAIFTAAMVLERRTVTEPNLVAMER